MKNSTDSERSQHEASETVSRSSAAHQEGSLLTTLAMAAEKLASKEISLASAEISKEQELFFGTSECSEEHQNVPTEQQNVPLFYGTTEQFDGTSEQFHGTTECSAEHTTGFRRSVGSQRPSLRRSDDSTLDFDSLAGHDFGIMDDASLEAIVNRAIRDPQEPLLPQVVMNSVEQQRLIMEWRRAHRPTPISLRTPVPEVIDVDAELPDPPMKLVRAQAGTADDPIIIDDESPRPTKKLRWSTSDQPGYAASFNYVYDDFDHDEYETESYTDSEDDMGGAPPPCKQIVFDSRGWG